jgi:hypothetical protein
VTLFVDVCCFGHSAFKCVEKQRRKRRERDTWKERGKNIESPHL